MSVAVVVVIIGLAGVGGWLWRIQRGLADLRAGLDRRADVRVDMHVRRVWNRLGRMHGEHVQAVDTRLDSIETVAAHSAVGQAPLARRVGAIEQWVRLRAAETREAER